MNAPSGGTLPEGVRQTDVVKFDRAHPAGHRRPDVVIDERPLTVRVDEASYALLRTPGADRDLVVGFLFTEGLIGGVDDILMLEQCPDSPDVINVRTRSPGGKPTRSLLITSSCGLCGRDDIEGLVKSLGRIESDLRVPLESVFRVAAEVRGAQKLFGLTGSAHASALFDPAGRVLGLREDVGRHNALDKLIGSAVMQSLSMSGLAVFLSGRTSLELIAKVARARIPVIAAIGAPTAAAIEAADRLGITLCGFLRESQLSAYTHPGRIVA